MKLEQIEIEEFQRVARRQETHENRYFQMLALCVTGSAAILGLSEELPTNLIPFIISPLFFITSRIAISNTIYQKYCAAYLLHWFDERQSNLGFESIHRRLKSEEKSKDMIRHLKRFTLYSSNPFLVLNFITLAASAYFSYPLLDSLYSKGSTLEATIYIFPILLLHLHAIILQIYSKTQSAEFFEKEIRKELEKANRIARGINSPSSHTTTHTDP